MHYHKEHCKDKDGDNYCGFHEHEYIPIKFTIEQLLATYFKIDLKKVEEEKMEILNKLKCRNEQLNETEVKNGKS